MTVAVIDDDLFLEHQPPDAAQHPESPQRLRAIRAQLTSINNWAQRPARDATQADVAEVHTTELIAAVVSMAVEGGGWFDADTYCGPLSARAAFRAAGAAMAAVDCAHNREHAFALTRPPGHHATTSQAMGFCLFNNIAIAARYAQRQYGLQRLAIVDIDVHHGNGTEEIFGDDSDVLYVSLHQAPLYPGTGMQWGESSDFAATLNFPLEPGTGPDTWLSVLTHEALPAVRAHDPDLILVSAGFDGYVGDPLAQLRLDVTTYAQAANAIAHTAAIAPQAATVWCLEGGYNLDGLAGGVTAVVSSLAA